MQRGLYCTRRSCIDIKGSLNTPMLVFMSQQSIWKLSIDIENSIENNIYGQHCRIMKGVTMNSEFSVESLSSVKAGMTHILMALAVWPLSVCCCGSLHLWMWFQRNFTASLMPLQIWEPVAKETNLACPLSFFIGIFVKIPLWKIWGGCCVCVVQACVLCVHPCFAFRCAHTAALISVTFIDMLKDAVWNRSPVSCVSGVADAAGHPDVGFSDSYLTLFRSIEHMSPKCESRKSGSIPALWLTCWRDTFTG